MFIVDLTPQQNNNQMCVIKSLFNCRIVFKPSRPIRDIRQYANCQNYRMQKSMVIESLST